MTKVDIHARIPADTKERAEKMAASDAPKGARPDLGVWLTALIERESARRARQKNACQDCDGAGYRDGSTCVGCGLSFERCSMCDGSGVAPSKQAKKGKGRR